MATPPSTLSIKVINQQRLFPEQPISSPHVVPLSIIDSAVVGFSPSSTYWLYDAPSTKPTFESLAASLRKTLNIYPQLSGQVHYNATNAVSAHDHTQRYRRISVSYGNEKDPGVDFVAAESPLRLDELVPTLKERMSGDGAWEAGKLPTGELIQSSPALVLLDLNVWEGLPSLLVQITTFACGGVAVAAKMAHCLADAQTFLQIIRDWAAIHRAMTNKTEIPTIGT